MSEANQGQRIAYQQWDCSSSPVVPGDMQIYTIIRPRDQPTVLYIAAVYFRDFAPPRFIFQKFRS
jgi:hypothetical protein